MEILQSVLLNASVHHMDETHSGKTLEHQLYSIMTNNNLYMNKNNYMERFNHFSYQKD